MGMLYHMQMFMGFLDWNFHRLTIEKQFEEVSKDIWTMISK